MIAVDNRGQKPQATHAQASLLDGLCLDHGTCTIDTLRYSGGVLMYVDCEDGSKHRFDEDGQPV